LQDAGRQPDHVGGGVAGGRSEGGVTIQDARSWQIDRLSLGDDDRIACMHRDRFQQAQPFQVRPVLDAIDEISLFAQGRQFEGGRKMRGMGAKHVALSGAEREPVMVIQNHEISQIFAGNRNGRCEANLGAVFPHKPESYRRRIDKLEVHVADRKPRCRVAVQRHHVVQRTVLNAGENLQFTGD
jgi:hypothetical protein